MNFCISKFEIHGKKDMHFSFNFGWCIIKLIMSVKNKGGGRIFHFTDKIH